MGGDGSAIIVWHQSDGINDQIFMSEFGNGEWKHPLNLQDNISPDETSAGFPRVAKDGDGNAIIAWLQYDDSGRQQLFMSELRNGQWMHPLDIQDNISVDGEDVYRHEVAMVDNGDAVAVWQQSDGMNAQIFVSEFRNGQWKHPLDPQDNISPDGDHATVPHVAMGGNGETVVAWRQEPPNKVYKKIFISEYRNGFWTQPLYISPIANDTYYPQVAMDVGGDTIVVWPQDVGTAFLSRQILMSEYRNGLWTHPANDDDYINPFSSYSYTPHTAMDNAGNAVIVWTQDLEMRVFMSEFRNGSWDHPVDWDDYISPPGGTSYDPRVAMCGGEGVIIVWEGAGIFMSEYRDGQWTYPADDQDTISPGGTSTDDPEAAMDGDGNAVIVWQQNDSIFNQIFLSEYR